MGSVISLPLPLLSAFALPVISSWSTQLNLAFFYMNWLTLVLSHGHLNVEIYGLLVVRTLLYILPSLVSLALDTALPSLVANIKAQGNVALPSRDGPRKVMSVMALSTFNVLLGVALQAGVEMLFTEGLSMRSALVVGKGIPLPWGVAMDLLKGLVLRGVLQYYIHRYVLHASDSPVARMHQRWQHSIRAPYSFVANYDHPIAWILNHWVPTHLPAILFRFHVLTFYLMLAVMSLEEWTTYSGYSVLPSTIILNGMARRQDAHMLSEGKGNFAPWGVLDWIHGTTVGPDVVDDVRGEMEKHDIQEKAGDAMDTAGTKLNSMGANMKDKARGKGRRTNQTAEDGDMRVENDSQ